MDLKEAEIFKNNDECRRHPWEMARFEVVLSLVRRYLKSTQKNPVILDIGCGDAFIFEMISKRLPDSKLIGVDTGFDQATINSYSKKYPNVEFHNSFEAMTSRISRPADIVLMLDVLEHIADDADMLKSIAQSSAINKDTLLFITVPAFQSIFSSHDRWLGHHRRYNINQLCAIVNQTGLKVMEAGYFFTSLLILRSIKVIVEKLSKSTERTGQGVGVWKGNAFIDGAIKIFLFLDYQLNVFINRIGLKMPGLSCYMICQKRES